MERARKGTAKHKEQGGNTPKRKPRKSPRLHENPKPETLHSILVTLTLNPNTHSPPPFLLRHSSSAPVPPSFFALEA